MGLIKSIMSATRGVLADQWVDYIRCDSLPLNVLVAKGKKYVGPGSSNTKGGENVITDGSKVDVADGQCMLIVENGKIVDFCAEPGQYVYQTGTQPSMLSGGFKGLADSFRQVGKRFTAGGQVLSSQYVYYVNTKEITGNKWGVGQVPFRDSEFNFTIQLSAYGEYSYTVSDPILFFTNVVGNVTDRYTRDMIDSQLKSELQTAMQPALGRIALKKIPYDQLPLFAKDICDELNEEMTDTWSALRGLSVKSFAMSSVKPDAESAKKITDFQNSRVYTDPTMLAAQLGSAQAEAMKTAAGNSAGAMTGFLGMGFAQQAGGANPAQLLQMAQEQRQSVPKTPAVGAVAAGEAETDADNWTCECGEQNTGNFCHECGKKKPEKPNGWVCPECSTVNKGKFCMECGKKKPADEPLYRCDKCGWEPADPKQPPKFCPECGDPFNEEDVTK